jgi:F420H(2)-dependent quinone reductase
MGADVLVLRTVGRKSGKRRQSPMFYVPYRDGYAVVASNAASRHAPAWWLNLRAQPEAEATVGGGWRAVRAREASAEERDELWPLFVDMYRGYDHYKEIATRDMPVVVLEPRS